MCQVIPIVIMTRNENKFLKRCIDSILENTKHPFHIYVIDNNSDDEEQKKILNDYSEYDSITIIRNSNNFWVLGLNKHLEYINKITQSKYFVLTDGDIEFNNYNCESCWLEKLVSFMEQYKCIGKIGLSLDWGLISNDHFYQEIYEQEKKLYNEEHKIGPLYISPVDTTAAIYRWDWSIDGYKFYPDHIRYLRPELYSCRTPREFMAEHHGWINYKEKIDKSKLGEKVKCFTLMGADLKKTQLNQIDARIKLFYLLLAKPMKILWGLRRRYYVLKYCLRKGTKKFDNH